MFTKFLSLSIKSKALFTVLILLLVVIELVAVWVVAWNLAPIITRCSPLWYGLLILMLSATSHMMFLIDRLEEKVCPKK